MAGQTNAYEAEQELIALAAGTATRREITSKRAEAQLAKVDWARLSSLLAAQRLLPTLGPRLLELAGAAAEGDFEARVAGAIEAARHQEALLQLISLKAQGALAAAGIRSSGLKGPALGETLYGEAGRRLSSDIDLLVAPEQLGAAVEVVRGLGYARPADHLWAGGLPLLHFSFAHEREELPPIELHWRIHWYETRFACDRLLQPVGADPRSWRPAPRDELAALLLFYARDGFTGLRQATDIGAWWDAHGAQLRRGELAQVVDSYPALEPAISAALVVAGRAVGIPVEAAIGDRVALRGRGRVAARLANAGPYRSEEQLFAEIGLIDGLLTPPGGALAFFRRQVAPPREVIREHTPSGRVTSPLGHAIRVLGRYALAIGRLLRVPGAKRPRFAP